MSVFKVFLLLILKQGVVTGVGDFDDSFGGYQFIYHHKHNLLLAIKNDTCYYIDTTLMQNNALDSAHRSETERALITALEKSGNGEVVQSTLTEMRDTYQDLLADFHCHHSASIYHVQDNPLLPPSGSLTAMMSKLQCDFEDGYCGWVQGRSDQLNWGLNKGRTSDHNTGPNLDHTLQDERGEYTYLNSSLGQDGDSAELLSPFLPLASPVCLRFWFTMYGKDVNSLAVYLRSVDGNLTAVWNTTGNQGPYWTQADVTVDPATSNQTQIVITASRGPGTLGDIAIDDVSLSQGHCPSGGSTATPGQQFVTAYSPTLHDLACDFEDGFCGWTQSTSDHADWYLSKGELYHAYGSGPSSDHTLLTDAGEYAYIDSSQKPHNVSADLLSPFLTLTTPVCVHLWYNMNGWDVNKLAFLVKTTQGQETELWSLTGDQGEGWNEVKVNVTSAAEDDQLQMIIRAYKGQSTAGDIAIDDVTATPGQCGP